MSHDRNHLKSYMTIMFPSQACAFTCKWKTYLLLKPQSKNNTWMKGICQDIILGSGVFKGRRTRHLPRATPFWGPPWGVTHVMFPYFWWQIYYSLIQRTTKQITSKYFAFKGAPYRNWIVQVLCFQRGPNSNCNLKVLCLQRGPQQLLKCVSTLLLNFIAGALKKL